MPVRESRLGSYRDQSRIEELEREVQSLKEKFTALEQRFESF